MSQDDYYSYDDYYSFNKRSGGYRGRKRTNKLTFFVIGMILFIVVFMPFYGTTLRYYIGTSFRLVFDYLGNVFQTVGLAMLVIVFMKFLLYHKISPGGMTMGILLLYMGAFLTGGTLIPTNKYTRISLTNFNLHLFFF
ncbi:MAG: hypothetical protein ACTSPN_16400 [Promethearchaeota archaeon]